MASATDWNHAFQATFHMGPEFQEQRDPKNDKLFRFSVNHPTAGQLWGDWAEGKSAAKQNALKHAV